MSKIMKLTGVATFIAACTQGINMLKGQTARFTDDDAKKLLRGGRVDKEGEKIPYFTETPDAEYDYDFTEPGATAVAAAPVTRGTVEDAGAPTPRVSRQRKTSPAAATA